MARETKAFLALRVRCRRICFGSALARQGERREIRWDLEGRWKEIREFCAVYKSSKSSAAKKLPKERPIEHR